MMFLEKNDFEKVVFSTPLISVDLCILKNRKLLIGKRKNPPAKNSYFVPGGRIRKNEEIYNAIGRILLDELGYKSIKKDFTQELLGFYEHFYKDNFLGKEEFTTHYVVLAFLIDFNDIENVLEVCTEDDQHFNYIWYDLNEYNSDNSFIHKYTKSYINKLL